MAKVLVIGHDETREILGETIRQLRARGFTASGYFDKNIPYARREVDSADFLLLGLSRAGRQHDSEVHAREKQFLQMVSIEFRSLRCVLVSDVDGYISAPYLATYGSLFKIVASDSSEVGSLCLFEQYQKVPREPGQIVSAIHDLLQTPLRASA